MLVFIKFNLSSREMLIYADVMTRRHCGFPDEADNSLNDNCVECVFIRINNDIRKS